MKKKILGIIIFCLLVCVIGYPQKILMKEKDFIKGDSTFNRYNANGLKEGRWIENDEYAFYENGVLSGIYLRFNSKGNISVVGRYDKGEMCDTWFYFDNKGNLQKTYSNFAKNTDSVTNKDNGIKYVPDYRCRATTYHRNSASIKSDGILLWDKGISIDSKSAIKYGKWNYYEDTLKLTKKEIVDGDSYFFERIYDGRLFGLFIMNLDSYDPEKNTRGERKVVCNDNRHICEFYCEYNKSQDKKHRDVVDFYFIDYDDNSIMMPESGFSMDSIGRIIYTYDTKDIKTDSIGFHYFCYHEKYYYPNGNLEKEGLSWNFDVNTANLEGTGVPDNFYDVFYDPKKIFVGEWKYYDENGKLKNTIFYDDKEDFESLFYDDKEFLERFKSR